MSLFRCLIAISIAICFVEAGVVNNKVTKIPSFLKICHRNDPKLNKCIKEAVEQIKPLLKEGIPEFEIPSCEPLCIPRVEIEQGSGSIAVKSSYNDIKIYGPSDFKLRSVKIDLEKDRVRIKIFLPQLHMVSNYSMEGKILMMPITGTGVCTGNYSDIEAVITMQGQRIHKEGETYFNIKDFYIDFNIGHAKIQLDNLFNGDKELGEAMNAFLNENWKTVSAEIRPVLEDTIAELFKKFANKIYHKYSLDVLLPP